MEPYIFAKRNRVHIIDLRKTVAAIVEAYHFLRKVVREGGTVLYVGTKRQAKETVRREAGRVGMPFVSERWLGGTLTNLSTIRLQIRRLEELERIEQSAELARYSKKALASFRREKRRVVRNLEGIRTMMDVPQVLLVVDPGTEHIAVKEARKLRIPVVAMLDTDADPEPIDIPIPANDDAMRSVDLVLERLTDGITRGLEEKTGMPARVDLSKGFSSADLDNIAEPTPGSAKRESAQQKKGTAEKASSTETKEAEEGAASPEPAGSDAAGKGSAPGQEEPEKADAAGPKDEAPETPET